MSEEDEGPVERIVTGPSPETTGQEGRAPYAQMAAKREAMVSAVPDFCACGCQVSDKEARRVVTAVLDALAGELPECPVDQGVCRPWSEHCCRPGRRDLS